MRKRPGHRLDGAFEVLKDSIDLAAFVRALLAVELGDSGPVDRLAAETTETAGEPRR